ncbi:MAG: zinc ribbon domain-containing protein [Patescibacteria group bacterium]|nr:zinc ribbon domain-containing protein [Patescibacteria group bacterium]MDD4611292.1 zinc ribbon domain-containing protein [Patescibacteria group bacterium]
MGIINDFVSGVKNNFKWQAQSAVIGGTNKGIKSVIKIFKNKCPKCGKPVKEEAAKFCPNCRANLVLVCKNPNCQRQSPLNTKFCPSCGSDLTK